MSSLQTKLPSIIKMDSDSDSCLNLKETSCYKKKLYFYKLYYKVGIMYSEPWSHQSDCFNYFLTLFLYWWKKSNGVTKNNS